MDADNIIMIIVWGIFISICVISSIKKNKQRDAKPTNSAEKPAVQLQHIASHKAVRKPRTQPQRPAETAPVIATALPPEGERVTKSRPMQPAQPIGECTANKARETLRDKDALRRTIILGQMLEPKF